MSNKAKIWLKDNSNKRVRDADFARCVISDNYIILVTEHDIGVSFEERR